MEKHRLIRPNKKKDHFKEKSHSNTYIYFLKLSKEEKTSSFK